MISKQLNYFCFDRLNLLRWILFVLGFLCTTTNVTAQPQTRPLIQPSDINYVGSFRVPDGDSVGCNGATGSHCFWYGGNALAYNPERNSLFFGGHDWVQQLAEIGIPSDFSSMAPVLQNLTDVTDGTLGQVGSSPNNKLAGTFVYNNRLIVTGVVYYGANLQTKSHGASGLNLSTAFTAFYSMNTAQPRGVSGWMTTIPAEWQSLLGGPALTGNCCYPGNQDTSNGPAAIVFNPDDVGIKNPIPGTTVLYYPFSNPIARYDTGNLYYNLATVIRGIAFPTGSRSVLFFGRQGTGPYCYGPGTSVPALAGTPSGDGVDPWCYDPSDSSKGTHAYPYRHQVWAYDANDLLLVKNGTKRSWEILPYAVWELSGMNSSGGAKIKGAAFDPATGRLYITEDYGSNPRVNVYQISVSGAQTTTQTPTIVLSASPTSVASGSSSTLTWSSTNATDCTASGAWSGSKATSGTQSTGALTSPATYSLTCTGIGGSATQSTTISITNQPPPDTIVVSPAALSLTGVVGGARPSAINVTVTTGNGNSWTSQDTCSFFNAAPTSGSSGSSHTLTPSSGWDSLAVGSYQCPITYSSPGNNSVVVQVAAIKQATIPTPAPTPPTVSISANPTSIASGSSSTLSWNSTNATSCTASGSWSGSKATSGSQSTGALTTASSYILSCTGLGGSASQSTTVAVTSPPSPPPPPQQGSNITVSNVSALQSAIAGLTSNNTILLADGTYNLNGTLYLPQNISNVTIKGASGNRDTVIIKGPGMTNSTVPFGFWADNIHGITFQDMTIRDFNQHAIILNGNVSSPVFRNLHIVDIGDQFLKNNPTLDNLNGIDDGILEKSVLEYSSTAPDSYTNGLDVHRGKNWIVRENTFKNFRAVGGLAGPAILMWNGSSDTTVVRNTFVNNQRDISFGLDPTLPVDGSTDHAGGLIANNFIYKGAISPDVPIAIFDSPGTKLYYNTILVNGAYPNAIEYRFPRTTGVDIKNNLADASILARDGATGNVSNNVTNASSTMFVNAAAADLHLLSTASSAINKGIILSVTDDFDGQSRPVGAAPDVGADEYYSSTALAPPATPSNLGVK